MTLTEFLLARIAEDESFSLSALAGASNYDQATIKWHWIVAHSRGSMWHPTPATPARVLVECKAKKAIVAEHRSDIGADPCDAHDASMETTDCDTLRFLALPYADHPDYQPEWRP